MTDIPSPTIPNNNNNNNSFNNDAIINCDCRMKVNCELNNNY